MRKEPSLRLPVLDEPSDFEQLSFLSDDEKKQGIELVKNDFLGTYATAWGDLPAHGLVKRREPLLIQAYDPRMAVLGYQMYYEIAEDITGVTGAEHFELATSSKELSADDQRRLRSRYLANLFVHKVAHEYRSEWALRVMTTLPTPLSSEKCGLLSMPESDVWRDDERLVLEFTYAMIHSKMTDELFDRAKAAWSPKGIVRRATWIGLYVYYMMLGHMNLTDSFKRGAMR